MQKLKRSIMSPLENRRVLLTDRPIGVPGPEFFAVETVPVEDLKDGEFLVQNAFLSVDPAMRGWVNDTPNYLPPVPVGDVMRAFSVAKSLHPTTPNMWSERTCPGFLAGSDLPLATARM